MISLKPLNAFISTKLLRTIDTLLSWYTSNGVKGVGPTSKTNIFQLDNGSKRLKCNSEIKNGETVVKFPVTLCLVTEDVNASFPYEGAGWDVSIACIILKEIARDSLSKWTTYFDVIASTKSERFDFIGKMVSEFEYPPIISTLQSYKMNIDAAYSKCPLSSHGGAKFKDFSWAISIVRARSFGIKSPLGLKMHAFIPLIEILEHGDNPLTISLCEEKIKPLETNMSNSHLEYDRTLFLEFKASSLIRKSQIVNFSYGNKSNDFLLMNYGFFPKFNPHDDFVLFDNAVDVCNWWISNFAKELAPTNRSYVKQSILWGISSVSDQTTASAKKKNIKNKLLIEKEFKILSGGRVDGRLKVAFTLAWLSADPTLEKINAVRLAEITIAIRAAQALSLFSTNLLDDLRMITSPEMISSLSDFDKINHERKLKYFEKIEKNIEVNYCTISEVITLSNSICSSGENLQLKTKPPLKELLLSFWISKKTLISDLILTTKVSKNEASGIMCMINNKN